MLVLISLNTLREYLSGKVYDEASLQKAIEQANTNINVNRIVFKRNSEIHLVAPVIYNGIQSLTIVGSGSSVDGSAAGSFLLDDDMTAVTEDGALVFNTAADITIHNLTIDNSATRGVVINIPEDAEGDDIQISLDRVNILNSALYGLHIDDNTDEFDDGLVGSVIGIKLNISHSNFIGNGTGAIDFDGIRVDERGKGDIDSFIIKTHIDANGGDGIELDEAGSGDVDSIMIDVTLNNNGFYNEEDLDDGFDIDEADDGDIDATLINVIASGNLDEGLDFDETGDGDIGLNIHTAKINNSADEAIKVDEEGEGNINICLIMVEAKNSGDDGIQFTELGEGKIKGQLLEITSKNNAKYGFKVGQWNEEGEVFSVEEAGQLNVKKVALSGNGEGDQIEANNVVVKES